MDEHKPPKIEEKKILFLVTICKLIVVIELLKILTKPTQSL